MAASNIRCSFNKCEDRFVHSFIFCRLLGVACDSFLMPVMIYI